MARDHILDIKETEQKPKNLVKLEGIGGGGAEREGEREGRERRRRWLCVLRETGEVDGVVRREEEGGG